jgi:hypothetical protein
MSGARVTRVRVAGWWFRIPFRLRTGSLRRVTTWNAVEPVPLVVRDSLSDVFEEMRVSKCGNKEPGDA